MSAGDVPELSESLSDFGEPAHIIYEEFDSPQHRAAQAGIGASWTVGPSDGNERYRVKLLAASGATAVSDIWILRATGVSTEYETVLHLNGASAERLVALMRNRAFDPSEGFRLAGSRSRLLPDAEALAAAYEHNPSALRAVVEGDASAADVVALARRKRVVAEFRKLLSDSDYFEQAVAQRAGHSKEGVWQGLFESDPWLLGVGLSSQLLVGWDPDRLEKVVSGFDVSGPGKRVDALMRTAGVVRLLAFAEIKTHETDLLGTEYRSGCWAPSVELTGAVAQSQGTVQLAQERLGTALQEIDEQGFSVPGGTAYNYRPRAFVVAGRLSEFVSAEGGHSEARIRSFELYRRSLQTPEVLTFDELLARAEVIVEVLAGAGGHGGPA